ncbi:unnamed protein product [Aphanomyces euteiches]
MKGRRLKSLREAASRSGSGTMYDRACLGLDASQIEAKLAAGEPHTIRLKVPEGKTVVKDMVRGYVQFDHSVIDDQVLMKSDGFPTYHLANVVDDYLMGITHKKGFLPTGLVNFVALLGWSPAEGSTQEIFTLDELKEQFSMDHVNKSGSVVNVERLRWINSRHIRSLFEDETRKTEVVEIIRPYLVDHVKNLDKFSPDYIWSAASLMKVQYD